ncbi:MAG: hypothetical protein WCW93_03785 [Candidatus Paceibacterota bacterium]
MVGGETSSYRVMKNDNGFLIPTQPGVVIGSSTVDAVFGIATTTTLCLSGDTCRTTWPSTGATINQLGQIGDVSTTTPMNYRDIIVYDTNSGEWVSTSTSFISALAGAGTVTSVDMSVPTGLSISGNPITTSGTLALTFTGGYSIPLTASTTEGSTAYTWGDHSLAGYLLSANAFTQAIASTTFQPIIPFGTYDPYGQATSTITDHTTTYNHANYNTAYGWGNHATAGYLLSVNAFTQALASTTFQPLEATLTDIADGTIAENLVNTSNPWADDEVADNITASNYILTTSFNGLFDARLSASSSVSGITALPNLSITESQISDLGTYESGLTAGDGLTRTVNDFDCDTANSATFGCLTAANWTSFNNKVGSSSIDTFSELDALVADGDLAVLSSAMTGTFDGNNFGGGAVAAGDMLYGSAGGTISELAKATDGNILALSGGLPAWVASSSMILLGDVTGTLGATVVGDNSHAHDTTTISGLDISADTNLTAGDALTLNADDIDFDGGASPGGSLGGTWASPTIDDLFILNTGDTGTGSYTFPYASTTAFSSPYASSTSAYFGTAYIPNLGTVAGSLVAVTATGQLIATTTPSGGGYNSLADLQAAVSNDFHNLGGTDANTTYTAGDFITLTGTDFDVDTGAIADGSTTILATSDAIYDFVRTSTSSLSSLYSPIAGSASIVTVGTLTSGSLGTGFTDVPVLQGGTGLSSFTGNSLFYSNAAGTALLFAATSTLNIGGNAGTVTNGVYTTSINTIAKINGFLSGETVASTSASMTALSDATWTLHNSYPAACSAGQFITTLGDTSTCAAPVGADEAYAAGWNADTGVPEKDDIYDWGHVLDTDDDGLVNGLDTDAVDTITEIAAALKDGSGDCGSGLLCLGDHTHTAYVYTAGDALTLTGQDFDFDGGASPGGSLGGTWASPTIDDLFLLNNGDVGTGVYDFGGATSLELPNGASPTVDTDGECAIDTTSGQLVCDLGTTVAVMGNGFIYPAFTYATSTAWTGTTTIPLGTAFVAETWHSVQCFTDVGTLNVHFDDGTNDMNMFNASTTVGTVGFTTNNTFTASEKRYVNIGTPATAPTKISCTIKKYITAD